MLAQPDNHKSTPNNNKVSVFLTIELPPCYTKTSKLLLPKDSHLPSESIFPFLNGHSFLLLKDNIITGLSKILISRS